MPQQKISTGKLSNEQGQVLVRLARQTIMEQLGYQSCRTEDDALALARQDQDLLAKRGIFICIKIGGQLRGCIGSLIATDSIVDGVRNNALNAAFQDPRFAPLTADELEEVTLEVSVLTEPQPLDYDGAEDLLNKLRVGIDGVIVRRNTLSATFLPQVWEQLPDSQQFLSHLCLKAGLPAEAWKTNTLEISTYQVQNFVERK